MNKTEVFGRSAGQGRFFRRHAILVAAAKRGRCHCGIWKFCKYDWSAQLDLRSDGEFFRNHTGSLKVDGE